jgi:hypothetical protein
MISYEGQLDIDNKLNYLKITGILNNVFITQKRLNKTLHNTLAIQLLLQGSETWTVKPRNTSRKTAAELKYLRKTAGCTWTDCKTKTKIKKALKITPTLDILLQYNRYWIQHVNRGIVMKYYFPTGRRNHGFCTRVNRMGQQVAQLHYMYMMMMMMMMTLSSAKQDIIHFVSQLKKTLPIMVFV